MIEKTNRSRGFDGWDRAKLTEVARKGGRAAHALGRAHEFTIDEAREAGRKGGLATQAANRRDTIPCPAPESK